ncbi:MAG: C25 family cysteine peptidase [Myxococcaceae bacterium]
MTSCTRVVLLAALICAAAADAATYTWKGGSGEWNTATNWTPTGVPGATDTATFSSATAGTVTITGTPASVMALTKSGAVTVTISGPESLTIGSGGITRTGGGAASVLDITTDVVVGSAGETWTISGGTNTFSGAISGANFTKVGGGTLILSGGNTFSAARVNAGTLQATSSGALGSGTITLGGGTLSLNSATALSLPVSLTTAANATLNVQGGAVTHAVASVTVNTGNTLTLSTGAGASLSVGTLSVSGTVAGAGPTLTVTGTLTGNGTLSRAVTVGAGANLSPTGAGLTTGALTLTSSTNLNFTVGSTVTKVTVNGALALAGVLNVSPGAGFAANTYTLMTATGAITDNHLSVPSATVPAGFDIGYVVSGANVNLIVTVRALGISLAKMQATYDSRHTQVAWTMGQEQTTLGYRLWKQSGPSLVRVGPDLLPGGSVRIGTDLKNGPSYVLEDWTTAPGGTYLIEAISMSGQSTWLGPVTATTGTFLPAPAPRAAPSRTPLVLSGGTHSAQLQVPNAPGQLAQPAPLQSWELAASPAVQIAIRSAGVYVVSAQSLFAAGLPVGVSVDSLSVSNQGGPIAFLALSADGSHLNAGDAIEFFGEGVDGRYTDVGVYWVTWTLGGGPQTSVESTEAAGTSAGPSFPESLQFQDRINYFGGLKNGNQQKFFGPWVYDAPEVRTYATPAFDVTSAEVATLEVALQGVTTGAHAVQVSLNGVAIGAVTGSGQQFMTGTFQIPSGLLVAGNNTVQLLATSASDASFETYQSLTYPRLYQSTGGPFYFTAPGGSTVHLADVQASATSVLDLTNPAATVALAVRPDPEDATASVVTVPSGGERSLYAFTGADVQTPVAITAHSPSRIHAEEADLVVIAHSSLLSSVQPLVSQRQAEGLRVALVDVQSVYDEFNFGQKDVSALHGFLAYAESHWSRPPRYVLLAGSASYNPRNYGGAGGVDLVPTPLLETQYMETAEDDALVSFWEANTPDMAVGRLPLSDPSAVDRAVAKILSRGLVTPTSQMLFVHDEDDPISNFTQQTQQVRAGLGLWPSSVLSRSDGLAEGSPQQAAADAALHTSLIAALVSGPAVVSYLGHGAEDTWSGSILSGEDVTALSSGAGASVFFAGGCLNGYFVDEGNEFLAGDLLSVPSGGAWAMVASSGATNPGEQETLALNFWQGALLDGLTLGQALMQAKYTVSDPDVRATFELFGDPSAHLAPKASSAATAASGLQARTATGCSTPGTPALDVLPFVAGALLLYARRRRALAARAQQRYRARFSSGAGTGGLRSQRVAPGPAAGRDAGPRRTPLTMVGEPAAARSGAAR